jgi:N-sulfoglucosamine sulfohydrolase
MVPGINRRQFLRRAGLAAAGGRLLGGSLASRIAVAAATPITKSTERPSILFALADDWGWPHAPAYGDKVVKTPTFDRVCREGVCFTQAYCTSPSCTPSRASMLTGQQFYRLEESGNLWSTLDKKFPVYADVLEAAGYVVGLTGKGWGPGEVKAGGRTRNPAGPNFRNFADFLKTVPDGKGFCFWFGSRDPHRPYVKGSGAADGLKAEDVQVPPFLPDSPEVRSDILDYYFEVQRYDRDVGNLLALLEKAGRLDNTLVVMTGDNGMPFPRCKTNLYDLGCHQPLGVRWPGGAKGGRVVDDYISFQDFAPTFLEAAGVSGLPDATGRSFLDILTSQKSGQVDPKRDRVIVGRERHHGGARPGRLGYPMRATRTREFSYVRNFRPDRWPAGDPEGYADIDPGPTRQYMMDHRHDPKAAPLFKLSFEKRPAEELYDLKKDPYELNNVADSPQYAEAKRKLSEELTKYLTDTKDPRILGKGDVFDEYPYRGNLPATRPNP